MWYTGRLYRAEFRIALRHAHCQINQLNPQRLDENGFLILPVFFVAKAFMPVTREKRNNKI